MNVLKPINTATRCRWYALCTNIAHSTLSHPVLDSVPICDRCLQKCKDLGMDVQEEIHHLAFQKVDAVPLCGAMPVPGNENISLNSDRITCPECRQIAGLDIPA